MLGELSEQIAKPKLVVVMGREVVVDRSYCLVGRFRGGVVRARVTSMHKVILAMGLGLGRLSPVARPLTKLRLPPGWP